MLVLYKPADIQTAHSSGQAFLLISKDNAKAQNGCIPALWPCNKDFQCQTGLSTVHRSHFENIYHSVQLQPELVRSYNPVLSKKWKTFVVVTQWERCQLCHTYKTV